ncbi:MAG: DUF899 domain-containing protein [Gammaproteobacteria bacterium]|nr:DUF899 domain-containing protein [Gammaproteobacteria bacterium]
MSIPEIQALEKQIGELTTKLKELQIANEAESDPVPNYTFETEFGNVTLNDLFGNKDTLFVIHNMGDGCRYCTIWADGINGFLPHLETAMSVVLVSKNDPDTQRRFANSRGWRFNVASHRNCDYAKDHTTLGEYGNVPGAAVYVRKGDQILKKNACMFGPGDVYCAMWHIFALAGIKEDKWTPQFRYWSRPEKMEDGGQGVID